MTGPSPSSAAVTVIRERLQEFEVTLDAELRSRSPDPLAIVESELVEWAESLLAQPLLARFLSADKRFHNVLLTISAAAWDAGDDWVFGSEVDEQTTARLRLTSWIKALAEADRLGSQEVWPVFLSCGFPKWGTRFVADEDYFYERVECANGETWLRECYKAGNPKATAALSCLIRVQLSGCVYYEDSLWKKLYREIAEIDGAERASDALFEIAANEYENRNLEKDETHLSVRIILQIANSGHSRALQFLNDIAKTKKPGWALKFLSKRSGS